MTELNFTFLKEEEIWGDNALQIMKDYGTAKGVSDLAIVQGCLLGGSCYKDTAGTAAGLIWSASSSEIEYVRAVSYNAAGSLYNPLIRFAAGCPALPFSQTSLIRPNNVRAWQLANGRTVKIGEYGEYPQQAVSEELGNELTSEYEKNTLKPTGKKYTFDSAGLYDYDTGFSPREFAEYEYKGKKYIRVEGRPYDEDSVLSNGIQVEEGHIYWIEVLPIEWLIDDSGVWVAKNALFAGIQFDTNNYYNGNFEATAIKKYLDKYFAKEINAGAAEPINAKLVGSLADFLHP